MAYNYRNDIGSESFDMPITKGLALRLAVWLEGKAQSIATSPETTVDIQVYYGESVSVNLLSKSDRQSLHAAHEFSNALVNDPQDCEPYWDLDLEVLVNGHDGLGMKGEPFDSFNLGERIRFNRLA